MRKIVTVLALASTLVLLSSCLKTTEYEPSPLQEGYSIYSYSEVQNLLTKDPIYVAFKLNTLLATAKKQQDANTIPANEITPHNVKVTHKEKETLLKTLLFGTTIIVEDTDKMGWTLTFSTSSAGEYDSFRSGDIKINTGGKLLGDLAPEDSWLVTTGTGTEAYRWLFGNTTILNALELCEIKRMSDAYWTIAVKSKASIASAGSSIPAANWLAEYELYQSGAGEKLQDFESVMAADFVFYKIDASGTTIAEGQSGYGTSTYKASNLAYRPSCGRTPRGGSEVATSPDVVTKGGFAKDMVTVTWKVKKNEADDKVCLSYYEISYNGYTNTLQ